MSRPFAAKFAGACDFCGSRFPTGESIAYIDGYDKPVCADCIDAPQKPAETPCPECWTVHKGECI